MLALVTFPPWRWKVPLVDSMFRKTVVVLVRLLADAYLILGFWH